MIRTPFARWFQTFLRDTRGSVSVEFVIIMPMLFWTFMAVYVYFDGYRQSTVNLKAAYTISDLLSRETDPINDEYVDSMHDLLQVLTRATSPTTLRITVVRWDADEDRYYRDWSVVRGAGISALTNTDVSFIAELLPIMPNNERVILVETTNTFIPLYGIGMENISLDNFVFTRPRFAPQVLWESS